MVILCVPTPKKRVCCCYCVPCFLGTVLLLFSCFLALPLQEGLYCVGRGDAVPERGVPGAAAGLVGEGRRQEVLQGRARGLGRAPGERGLLTLGFTVEALGFRVQLALSLEEGLERAPGEGGLRCGAITIHVPCLAAQGAQSITRYLKKSVRGVVCVRQYYDRRSTALLPCSMYAPSAERGTSRGQPGPSQHHQAHRVLQRGPWGAGLRVFVEFNPGTPSLLL